MKQTISIDLLNELSEKGKERLIRWWKPKEHDLVAWHDGYKIEDGLNWSIEIIGKPDLVRAKANKMLPLLSIGQMIEFLKTECEKHPDKFYQLDNKVYSLMLAMSDVRKVSIIKWQGELCDALWQAVKEILEEDEKK